MSGSSLIAAVVAAIFTPLILRGLSKPGLPPRSQGQWQVLEYSLGLRLVMLGGGLFFLAIAGLAYRFPGKTDPSTLPWVIALFLFFALFNASVFALMGRSRVFWDEQQLRGPNAWGKISTIPWSEVTSLEYVEWAQGFRLRGPGTSTIWVSPMMAGFDQFFLELQQRGLIQAPEGEPESD